MNVDFKTIFVTVGTTRFDRLAKKITELSTLKAFKKLGCNEVILQIGKSDSETGEYIKNDIKITIYRYKDSIEDDIKNSDLVISHAGAGSCLEVLEANKPLLVVVNEDLMDNHQLELAEQLQIDGHLYYCTCDTLESTVEQVDFRLLKPFPKSDPSIFIKFLDSIFLLKSKSD